MITVFVLGYIVIALEHVLKLNKATFALILCGALWTILSYEYGANEVRDDIIGHLGDTCEILVYLIGAMTIVDLIERYGGFFFITSKIKADNKVVLLWILLFLTFFMSAVLDNMTTTIIMVAFLAKIIKEQKERWLFAGVVVIAANSGGAWSPIGDVTTIMLWMNENVTSSSLMSSLLLPSLVSAIVPAIFASFVLKRRSENEAVDADDIPVTTRESYIAKHKPKLSRFMFYCGVAGLIFVPVFKTITGLPPLVGMIISLGILWIISDIAVIKAHLKDELGASVTQVVRNIDMPTIMFFLGILMSVGALQTAGILTNLADILDSRIHEPYIISSIIGVCSSVVDNVPLVAACMDMYPVATDAMVSTAVDPAYMQYFVQDGLFWHLLTYCAGVGGSLLIIGSAAGVVAMGMENIPFLWYAKRISLMALVGYLTGIVTIYISHLLL